ncbi:MAG: septum formation initiator family protein [Caldimicrobium sp.]|nr:septum formation initiator family protein [Caldimicrobium sp.]MCX7874280.1 septum formation initiator family protein [Caldimicrobium sp.]MDW8093913.1 septum formation initiator family protein [Caldimicrobium sp.]
MKKQPVIYLKPYSKRSKKKRLKKILLVVLSVLVFFSLMVYLLLHWMIKKEGRELEKLRMENQILRSEIKRFQSSDEAYEELLRTKMGYIKEGEKLIIYSDLKKK